MKKLSILLLILVQGFVYAQKPCPPYGSAKPGTLIYTLNIKKNRIEIPSVYKPITIEDFLQLPDDSAGDGKAYKLTGGYVIKVKKEGPESCNCKSKTERDYHVVVVPAPKYDGDKSKYVIVEFTPLLIKKYQWSDADIKKLKGHYVDFYGFKFADLEHKNMSVKSNPKRKTCWRGTINEIHPITKFEIKK